MQLGVLRALGAWGVACVSALSLTACGGGGGPSSVGGGDGTSKVTAVSFRPTTFDVAPGGKIHFSADAKFSDGSSMDITPLGIWTSSAPAVASVGSSTGVLQGIADGLVDVTVTYRGVSAVAHVRVGIYLQSVEVTTAQMLGLGIGATFQFEAHGQYTDQARDVTQLMDWRTSNPSVLRISNASNTKGLATAIAPGEVTVTSASSGISTGVYVEVLPIQSLAEYRDVSTCNARLGGLSVDAVGRALSTWSCPFSGAGTADLLWSSTSPGTANWAVAAPIRTALQRSLPQAVRTASNDSGMVVAAWGQVDGVYAARFAPASGWEASQQIGPSLSPLANEVHSVGIDAQGNALVYWRGEGFRSSSYSALSGRWSAPVDVPVMDAGRCAVAMTSMSMDATGRASLVWYSANCNEGPGGGAAARHICVALVAGGGLAGC